MKTLVLSALLFILAIPAFATRKGLDLDESKTQESIEECERIANWGLLPEAANLEITCGEDNHIFRPKLKPVIVPGKLRIGNFNLLHPGTDKTLFKDFDLVAELIDTQFDVMAGIELVDVVADPEKKNKKLRPFLEAKYRPVLEAQREIDLRAKKIGELEAQIAASARPSDELEAKKRSLAEARQNYENARGGLDSATELLTQASQDVETNSSPGLAIFGVELFKKQRLARLAAATARKIEAQMAVNSQKKIVLDSGWRLSELERDVDRLSKLPQVDPLLVGKLAQTKKELAEQLELRTKAFGELQELSRYYRVPGYLTLLAKLRERNPNWALVLSPHGDAAEETNTQERVGYYYRTDRLALAKNIHCGDRFLRDSFACYPNFYASYMGDDVAGLFSRRPFLASFTDGRTDFSLIASHVVFEPPKSEELQKTMLQKAFKVEKLSDLGPGITKQNFARFVEVSLTLDLIDKLRRDGLKRIIYAGDFNLESDNPFWKRLFRDRPGTKVLVDEQTSVSEVRFTKNVDTLGLASNYDHFVLSEEEASACGNAAHVNFVTGEFSQKVKQRYHVREEAAKGPYQLSGTGEATIAKHTELTRQRLSTVNVLISNKGEVTLDEKTMASDLANLRERVFTSQLSDATFYKVFVQVISDHLPIRMDCSF